MAFAWIRTRLFGRYLFITNSISFGSLYAAGDLAGQTIEGIVRGDKKINYDWKRTGKHSFVSSVFTILYNFVMNMMPLCTYS